MKTFGRIYRAYWWLWRRTHKQWKFCVILTDADILEDHPLLGQPWFRARQLVICDRDGREVGWGAKPWKLNCEYEMYHSLRRATNRVEE